MYANYYVLLKRFRHLFFTLDKLTRATAFCLLYIGVILQDIIEKDDLWNIYTIKLQIMKYSIIACQKIGRLMVYKHEDHRFMSIYVEIQN
jgi:hypothetical protein